MYIVMKGKVGFQIEVDIIRKNQWPIDAIKREERKVTKKFLY